MDIVMKKSEKGHDEIGKKVFRFRHGLILCFLYNKSQKEQNRRKGERRVSQSIKLIDEKYLFATIAALLDKKREKAFLLSGKIKERNCVEVDEYFDLKDYIEVNERNLMKLDKKFFFAALKGFAKENKVLIFLHSHPHEKRGQLQFSAGDDNFYISLVNEAKKVGYELPLLFGIMSEEDILWKGFGQEGVGICCSMENGYENYSEERYSIQILYSPEFRKSVLYHKANNEARVVSRESAKEIRQWKAKYENGDLSQLQRMVYQKLILDAFPERKYRTNLSTQNYQQCKTIDNLQLMLQLGCNLGCKYCYADCGTYAHNKNIIMTEEVAKKSIDRLLENGIQVIRNIFFFGGEPSLFPEVITAVCDYCARLVEEKKLSKMPTFTMVTNAVVMADSLISTIEKYKIKVTVSIDGPKNINDALRVHKNGMGTYDSIFCNIKRMKEKNAAPVMLEATYTKLHEEENMTRNDLREWLQKEFEVPTIYVADCDGSELEPENKADGAKDTIEKIRAAIHSSKKLPADIGKKFLQTQRSLNNKQFKNNLFCTAGYRMLCVLGNGDYYPCHRFSENADYKIGNLITEENLQLREYVNKDNFEKCRKCWAKEFCVECNWNIFSGGIGKADCEDIQKITAYSILAMANLTEEQKRFLQEKAV